MVVDLREFRSGLIYTYIHIYMCIYIYVCLYVYLYICMCVCIYIYICVCVCVYIYIHIHTHTHTWYIYYLNVLYACRLELVHFARRWLMARRCPSCPPICGGRSARVSLCAPESVAFTRCRRQAGNSRGAVYFIYRYKYRYVYVDI